MRIVWTLVKVIVGLAILIPVAAIALGAAVGVLGLVVGLAAAAIKLAVVALVAVGAVKLLSRLFRGPAPRPQAPIHHALPPRDPHYEAAMRELELELGR
jgi:hypothetical protein